MLKNDGTIKDNTASSDKPTAYIPYVFSPAVTGGWSSRPASWAPAVDLELAGEYYNIVTDTLLDPSGEADDSGSATYTVNDIQRASAGEIAGCDVLLVKMAAPYTAGAVDENYNEEDDEQYGMYTPTSLQYGAYTASGARNPSLGGEMVTRTFNDGYTMQTEVRKQNLSYGWCPAPAGGSPPALR